MIVRNQSFMKIKGASLQISSTSNFQDIQSNCRINMLWVVNKKTLGMHKTSRKSDDARAGLSMGTPTRRRGVHWRGAMAATDAGCGSSEAFQIASHPWVHWILQQGHEKKHLNNHTSLSKYHQTNWIQNLNRPQSVHIGLSQLTGLQYHNWQVCKVYFKHCSIFIWR